MVCSTLDCIMFMISWTVPVSDTVGVTQTILHTNPARDIETDTRVTVFNIAYSRGVIGEDVRVELTE